MSKVTAIPSGLATLALLKQRFDENRDHLSLFVPFVEDAIANCASDQLLLHELTGIVDRRHGLRIPTSLCATLLNKLVRKTKLRNVGGAFVRGPGAEFESLDDALLDVRVSLDELGEAFSKRLADSGVGELGPSESLEMLASFIAQNKVPLLLSDVGDIGPPAPGLALPMERAAARFIVEHLDPASRLRAPLVALTEGVVLKDLLLLTDIATAAKQFRDLHVILDTPVAFSVLGLHGDQNARAAREMVSLLRQSAARLSVFDRTIAEMQRVLEVYERSLARPGGVLQLHRTELTDHVVARRLSPSDIRTIAATLSVSLDALGIKTIEVPRHEARFTLNEAALALALKDDVTGETDSPRIRHDVDAVAAVLTMRRGQNAASLETARAVFCTSTGRVIRNVTAWFRSEGAPGLAPVVHQHALSGLAWLKRPELAPELKLHELAASCHSALRPSRQTWAKALEHLRKLVAEGQITSDQAVAIAASDLTGPMLAGADETGASIPDTLEQAFAREAELNREVGRSEMRLEMARLEQRLTTEITGVQQAMVEAKADVQRKEVALAALADRGDRERRDLELREAAQRARVEQVAASVGKRLSVAILSVLGVAVVLTTALALPGVFDIVPPAYQPYLWGILALGCVALALLGWHGTSPPELARRLELMVRERVVRLLRPPDVL